MIPLGYPEEILGYIFLLVKQEERKSFDSEAGRPEMSSTNTTLSLVCKYWRRIVEGSSQLWTDIWMKMPSSLPDADAAIHYASTFLSRAQGRPGHLHMELTRGRHHKSLDRSRNTSIILREGMKDLISKRPNVTKLTLSMGSPKCLDSLGFVIIFDDGTFDHLEELAIEVPTGRFEPVSNFHRIALPKLRIFTYSFFEPLSLAIEELTVAMRPLTQLWPLLRWGQLQCLDASRYPHNMCMVLSTLAQCESIEDCRALICFVPFTVGGAHMPDMIHGSIRLNHLKTLNLTFSRSPVDNSMATASGLDRFFAIPTFPALEILMISIHGRPDNHRRLLKQVIRKVVQGLQIARPPLLRVLSIDTFHGAAAHISIEDPDPLNPLPPLVELFETLPSLCTIVDEHGDTILNRSQHYN